MNTCSNARGAGLITFASVPFLLQRLTNAEMPVHFVTGHSHRRDFKSFDTYSTSFEAGRYLDTVGFLSYNTPKHVAPILPQPLNATREEESESPLASHVFIDATVPALETALGVQEGSLRTSDGEDLAKFIKRVQIELGLEEVIGWACETYYLKKNIAENDSLWGFFQREVVPARFDTNDMIIIGNGAWRASILSKGEIRLDDAIAVSPFNNTLYLYEDVPAQVIEAVNESLNGNATYVEVPGVPAYVFAPASPHKHYETYRVVVDSFEANIIEEALEKVWDGTRPTAITMTETTSSIWIDYFRENHVDYCKMKGKAPPSKYVSTTVFNNNATEDTLNTIFFAVAMMVVLALGTMYVQQRSMIHSQLTNAREFATLEALHEYEGSRYEDSPSDEFASEGQFV